MQEDSPKQDTQFKNPIKRMLAKYLGLWVLPAKTYIGIQKKFDREVSLLQVSCRHKKTILYYSPFITCTRCQKVMREATSEEMAEKKEGVLKKLNLDVKKVLAERATA